MKEEEEIYSEQTYNKKAWGGLRCYTLPARCIAAQLYEINNRRKRQSVTGNILRKRYTVDLWIQSTMNTERINFLMIYDDSRLVFFKNAVRYEAFFLFSLIGTHLTKCFGLRWFCKVQYWLYGNYLSILLFSFYDCSSSRAIRRSNSLWLCRSCEGKPFSTDFGSEELQTPSTILGYDENRRWCKVFCVTRK